MEIFVSTNKRKEVVDITQRVQEALKNISAKSGVCHIFLTHTTAALTTADLDPGTDLDMLDAFEAIVPPHKSAAEPARPASLGEAGEHKLGSRQETRCGAGKIKYRHPHNPEHVGDHIMSSLIGASVLVPVRGGELVLGTWQRVVLIELDGPRERNLVLNFTENG